MESKLYSVIGLSDLSTYECVYNDICTVMDEEETIIMTIPEVQITDINVDITSLDYMFEDKKANTNTVSQQRAQSLLEDYVNNIGDAMGKIQH